MTFAQPASKLLARGKPIFPVDRGKKPLCEWKRFQERLPAEGELTTWGTLFPDANIGMATGKLSGCVVIDCDSPEAAARFLESYPEASETLQVQTGRGRHFYFQFEEGIRNDAGKRLGAGIDIRGEGGFVVVPPSIHANGNTYRWLNRNSPAKLPERLREILLTCPSDNQNGSRERFDTAQALAGVPEGRRDETLFKLASKLRAADVPQDMAESLILEAARNCESPFPEREALEKVSRAYKRYEVKQEKASNQPRLFTASELLSQEETEPEWHVQGLLPTSGLSVWVGKPKSGKSTTARALAVATAQARPFLGRDIRQGPAILIALEDRKRDITRHLRTLGLQPEDPLFVATDLGPKAVTTLQAWVKEHRPALVVVDTLQRAAKIRDLDSYAEATTGLDGFLRLARESGAHVALIHHAPKGGNERDPVDSPLGSTAIAGTVDIVLHLKRARDRARYLATVARVGEDLPETVLTLDAAGWPTLGAVRVEAEAEEVAGEILAYLEKHPGVIKQEIRDAIPGDNTRKDRALDLLVDRGRVERTGAGKKNDPFRYSCLVAEPIYPASKQETKNEPQGSQIKDEMLAEWEELL